MIQQTVQGNGISWIGARLAGLESTELTGDWTAWKARNSNERRAGLRQNARAGSGALRRQ